MRIMELGGRPSSISHAVDIIDNVINIVNDIVNVRQTKANSTPMLLLMKKEPTEMPLGKTEC